MLRDEGVSNYGIRGLCGEDSLEIDDPRPRHIACTLNSFIELGAAPETELIIISRQTVLPIRLAVLTCPFKPSRNSVAKPGVRGRYEGVLIQCAEGWLIDYAVQEGGSQTPLFRCRQAGRSAGDERGKVSEI